MCRSMRKRKLKGIFSLLSLNLTGNVVFRTSDQSLLLSNFQTVFDWIGLDWIGLGWIGLGWGYSFDQSYTDAIEENIIFIAHTILIILTNTTLIYQLQILTTPTLIVIHTEQFINEIFIKLSIFLIMLILRIFKR